MTGAMVKLPPDEDTPEKRVTKIFNTMDFNHDHKLTYEEFAEGSKKDPTIVQVGSVRRSLSFVALRVSGWHPGGATATPADAVGTLTSDNHPLVIVTTTGPLAVRWTRMKGRL